MRLEWFSYIIMSDNPREIYYIQDMKSVFHILSAITVGSVIDIRGLGKLKVTNIDNEKYEDEGEGVDYYELGFYCHRV